MPTVVGVKLRFAGKVLWFDPAGFAPVEGEHVIVSTERGQEYGEIVMLPREVEESELAAPLKPVLRIADEQDRVREASYREHEPAEMERFRSLIRKHALDMKPIGVEHLFDDSKVVFYFSAEERVDFRDLVRELASEFKSRIDLRQVGVRDAARHIGGLGHCGQPLCCVRFSGDFQPVSIRMAKEQDLPLNPLKNSGLCGRLMCCLRYENEAYKEFKQRAPKCGTPVEMPEGEGKVVGLNVPRETVTIRHQGGPDFTVPLTALDCSVGRGCPCVLAAEAMPAPAAAAAMQRSTPQLREAEQGAEPEGGERSKKAEGGQQRVRTKRERSGQKKEGGAPAPAAETPKASAGQGGRRRPPRQAAVREQEAVPAPPAAAPPARRRRRRRHPSEGGSTTEGTE